MAFDNSSWDTSKPANTDLISSGDDEIRSAKSTIQEVISDEHYFDTTSASSASGGVHKLGSARIFSGTRASLTTPSSADSAGRLFYGADSESLHYLDASSMSTIVSVVKPTSCIASAPSGLMNSAGDWIGLSVADTAGVGGHPAAWFGAGGSSIGTVPSGVSGRFNLTLHMTSWYSHTLNPTQAWRVMFEKGGIEHAATVYPSSFTTHGMTVSATYDLSSGDTFQLFYTGSVGTWTVARFSAIRAL